MFKKCLKNEYFKYDIPEERIEEITNKIDEEILQKIIEEAKMKIYRIRNKETQEFIKLNSGKHVWYKLNYCTSAITNHNNYVSYEGIRNKYNPITNDKFEIVEFTLTENKTINIKY
jgi:hypothetical protein